MKNDDNDHGDENDNHNDMLILRIMMRRRTATKTTTTMMMMMMTMMITMLLLLMMMMMMMMIAIVMITVTITKTRFVDTFKEAMHHFGPLTEPLTPATFADTYLQITLMVTGIQNISHFCEIFNVLHLPLVGLCQSPCLAGFLTSCSKPYGHITEANYPKPHLWKPLPCLHRL